MRMVSRCRPNVRAASRMLIPSTITARRTRRYTSTWYIHRTIHGVGYTLMNDSGRYYSLADTQQSSAHAAHFTSAVYTKNRRSRIRTAGFRHGNQPPLPRNISELSSQTVRLYKVLRFIIFQLSSKRSRLNDFHNCSGQAPYILVKCYSCGIQGNI